MGVMRVGLGVLSRAVERSALAMFKQFVTGIFAVVLLTGVAMAGPLEDGLAAAERGDYAEALRLWQPLAEQGNASAQFNLGVMYERGHGVPQDHAEAAKWYRLAAEQGDAFAQFNLGLMYADGDGVPQDDVLAHMWWNLAAAQGIENAKTNRDIVASRMTPDQLAEAQRMAREWKPAAER